MIRKLFVFSIVSLVLASAAFGQRVIMKTGEIVMVEPVAGGFLGIQAKEITKKNFGDYDLREVRGVGVESVVKNSPADEAGIQKGDVIVRLAGEEVSSVNKLLRLLSEIAPDHTAKITIVRGGGEEIELTATLRERAPRRTQIVPPTTVYPYPSIYGIPRISTLPPSSQSGTQTILLPPIDDDEVFVYRSGAASRQIGVNATPLTEQLGENLGVEGGAGLLIDFVRENSPAAKAGLKAGDVITEADGKTVKTKADLIDALNEKKEGDVTLTIVREKNRQTVKVTPAAPNQK